ALFNEPGPPVREDEYAAFCVMYQKALAGCSAVVLSGSLPRGLSPDTYAELGAMAAAAGVPAVLDAPGGELLRGAAARPAIVKPTLAELEVLAGRSLSTARGTDTDAVAVAARKLKAAGPAAVVVTLGPDGLWALTDDGSWRAVPPADVRGNPTGAGDAVAAGLVHGLVLGRPWEERLRHAVALGTASAAAPVAGEFSHAAYAEALARVTVNRGEAGGCRRRRWARRSRPPRRRAAAWARSTSSASSTPRRSSPVRRPPAHRWSFRSARTASPTTARSTRWAAPAPPSRARRPCRW